MIEGLESEPWILCASYCPLPVQASSPPSAECEIQRASCQQRNVSHIVLGGEVVGADAVGTLLIYMFKYVIMTQPRDLKHTANREKKNVVQRQSKQVSEEY